MQYKGKGYELTIRGEDMAKGESVVKKKDKTSHALGEGSVASESFLLTIRTCKKAFDKSF